MPKIVDHEARRRELSAVAAQLICAGGLEAATIREVAHHSGYSKGIVEHYFDDKADLIDAALDSANRAFQQRVSEQTAGLSGLAALRARVRATLPLNPATRDEWKVRLVFWSLATTQPELGRQQARRFQRAIDFFIGDIEQAKRDGELHRGPTTEQQARQLTYALFGLSNAALHNPSRYRSQQLVDEGEALINTICPGPGHLIPENPGTEHPDS